MSITLLDQTETAKLIDRVTSASSALVSDIHLAACSSLYHIREHGNYTGALALVKGLHTGVRVQALAEWFKVYSKGKFTVTLNPKTKEWKADLSKDRSENDFDIEGAMALSFADFRKEPSYATLSMDKFVKGLKRTAINSGMFAGTAIPKVSLEARALAMQLVQFIESQKVAKVA